jgi:ubiquinone/menaquinone biosynthesis C-methylase UbiE
MKRFTYIKEIYVNKMVELVSNSLFNVLSFMIAIRDILANLDKVVDEIGIQSGDIVLDYGCGLGSFTIPAAKRAGEKGKVFALDIHPLAIKRTKKKAQRNKITNIEYIHSDCDTGLDEASVDVVLFYDLLKSLLTPQKQLNELHRILRPRGILCVKDIHSDDQILSIVTEKSLFKLKTKGKKQFIFSKS